MDIYENNKKTTPPTIFQEEDQVFSSKILGRQSTVGSCSSRIYYRASSEGVPFQWETQPGKPIARQPDEILPPLSPPPAVLAMGLPKPCIDNNNNIVVDDESSKVWRWTNGWLVMKMIKKRMEIKKWKVLGSRKMCNSVVGRRSCGSARYPSESTHYSSESSSFASTSSNYSWCSNGNNKNDKRDLMHGKAFTCGPRNLSSYLVTHLAKRS